MVSTKHCCYGRCNSDSRYWDRPHMQGVKFIPFPKPITQPEKCDRWIRLCGRVGFERNCIKKHTYICTKHFVGGKGPSLQFPDPIPAVPNRVRTRSSFAGHAAGEQSILVMRQDLECDVDGGRRRVSEAAVGAAPIATNNRPNDAAEGTGDSCEIEGHRKGNENLIKSERPSEKDVTMATPIPELEVKNLSGKRKCLKSELGPEPVTKKQKHFAALGLLALSSPLESSEVGNKPEKESSKSVDQSSEGSKLLISPRKDKIADNLIPEKSVKDAASGSDENCSSVVESSPEGPMVVVRGVDSLPSGNDSEVAGAIKPNNPELDNLLAEKHVVQSSQSCTQTCNSSDSAVPNMSPVTSKSPVTLKSPVTSESAVASHVQVAVGNTKSWPTGPFNVNKNVAAVKRMQPSRDPIVVVDVRKNKSCPVKRHQKTFTNPSSSYTWDEKRSWQRVGVVAKPLSFHAAIIKRHCAVQCSIRPDLKNVSTQTVYDGGSLGSMIDNIVNKNSQVVKDAAEGKDALVVDNLKDGRNSDRFLNGYIYLSSDAGKSFVSVEENAAYGLEKGESRGMCHPGHNLVNNMFGNHCLSYQSVCNNDQKMRFFTGLNCFQFFSLLHFLGNAIYKVNYINVDGSLWAGMWPGPRKWSPGEELFMTLVRLRRGYSLFALSHFFQVSQVWLKVIFTTWLRLLYRHFKQVRPKITLDGNEQSSLRFNILSKTLKKVKCVVEFSRVKVGVARKASERGVSRSKGSNYHTYKCLIAYNLSGSRVFTSDLFADSVDDRKVLENCGILNILEKRDMLFSNGGYLVKKVLSGKQVVISVPCFLHQGKAKLSLQEEFFNRRIEKVRRQIEHYEARLKKYKLLSGKIPLELAPLACQAIHVACDLISFKDGCIAKCHV